MQLDMYRNVDDQLRAKMQHSEVTCLSFSFRRLSRISGLEPFVNLQFLQLDNNCLKRIAGLEHLVRTLQPPVARLAALCPRLV